MSCPKCKTSTLTVIALNIGEKPITMRNCSGCDTRWWDSEGESLKLPGVLELAARR
jgi:transcriptional regulator NrdR family protein